jgi:hypothetical protein
LYSKYFWRNKAISIQAIVTSASDIWPFLTEGQKGKFQVTYCIHCCQIFTMLPNKHFLMVAEIQCKFSLVLPRLR